MKRIHIVGMSPRTGTTLMMELMASCFEFEAYADHEMSILYAPITPVKTFCSKHPGELTIMQHINDPNVWVICMIRDPRDVIVSKHRKAPDYYWTDLKNYKTYRAAFEELCRKNSRVIPVMYEDLVKNPDKVQDDLEKQIPFLKRVFNFSEFDKVASPTEGAVAALGGVRKITGSSIGNWRNHLPRVKAQIELHGDISEDLIRFGYETDKSWMAQLVDVQAVDGPPRPGQGPDPLRAKVQRIERMIKFLLYRIGFPRRKEVIINK